MMTPPTATLILLTVPYFIAVIAKNTYTNKLIKSGKITAVTSSDSESLDNSDNENNITDIIDNSNSNNDNNSKSTSNNQ